MIKYIQADGNMKGIDVNTLDNRAYELALQKRRFELGRYDLVYGLNKIENKKVLDVSELKHFRINHSKLFADKENHINGIENFWSQAKRHMHKFNDVPKEHFGIFFKEV